MPTASETCQPPRVLFTAFEPSGDDHASAVIAELRRRRPALELFAWGGPKMERAGATIVERTGDDAVIGMPGIAKILEHRSMNKRIARWFDAHPDTLHVPVDSPAANFPICKIARARGCKVVHLVAPQMWAWGAWRVAKLRRLTDLVLCLLPFEEGWFLSRKVPARFVGHPLFDRVLDFVELDRIAAGFPPPGLPTAARGATSTPPPKVALMPGSRPGELSWSVPLLLDAFRRLGRDLPGTAGVMAVTRPEVGDAVRARAESLGGWPENLALAHGQTDAAVRWCDIALVVSGTVTLQIAMQCRPMVTFYRPNPVMYHLLARWIVSTPYFTLPNLIAGRGIIRELIPHFGDAEPLALEVIRLVRQPGYADDQRAALARVVRKFEGVHAASRAADAIEQALGLEPAPKQPAGAVLV